MSRRKWFQLVGEDGKALSAAAAVCVDVEDVDTFRDAAKKKYEDSQLQGIASSDLLVYTRNRQSLDAWASLVGLGEKEPLFVEILHRRSKESDVRGLLYPKRVVTLQDASWFGLQGPLGGLYSFGPNVKHTLLRSALTSEIIRRLDEKHVLLVNSPTMTGKSSLMTLVGIELLNRSKQLKHKSVIFSFASAPHSTKETFLDIFKRDCNVDWDSAVALANEGYTIFLVVDETQQLYNDWTSPYSIYRSEIFWQLVKRVCVDPTSRIRVLMFESYGFDFQFTRGEGPLRLPRELVLMAV